MSIIIKQISKSYKKQKALDNISFTVKEGEIVALLGPNGAGKSTLMKIITCYLDQDDGKIELCNLDIQQKNLTVKNKIGYLAENNPLYTNMYVKEYLSFIANIYKLNNIKKHVTLIIKETGLEQEQSKKNQRTFKRIQTKGWACCCFDS